MQPSEPTAVDATELVNELGMRIAQLTVENIALHLELRHLKNDPAPGIAIPEQKNDGADSSYA